MHAIVDAINVRQPLGYFDDDCLRTLDNGAQPHIGWAEVEISVLVDGARFQDGDIDRIEEPAVVIRHLAEIEWNIVTEAAIVLGSVVTAEVPIEPLEMSAIGVGLENGARLEGKARPDPYVMKIPQLVNIKPCKHDQ